MLLSSMDAKQAEEIAIGFLRHRYSIIKVERSVLEEDGRIWRVELLGSSFGKEKKITVAVNARIGSILGWR